MKTGIIFLEKQYIHTNDYQIDVFHDRKYKIISEN
jgi:hypothetical protein